MQARQHGTPKGALVLTCWCVCRAIYTEPLFRPKLQTAARLPCSTNGHLPASALPTASCAHHHLRRSKHREEDGCHVRFRFLCKDLTRSLLTENVSLLYSTGVANGSSLISMAALSSSSPVWSGTRLHMAPIRPKYMLLPFQGRNTFWSAVDDVPQQAAGPSSGNPSLSGSHQVMGFAVGTGRVPSAASSAANVSSSAAAQQADGPPGHAGRMSGCHLLLRAPHRGAILGG